MVKRYRVILERNELGGYTVTVPALPGCLTQGKNREEALRRIKEAILCHLEGLQSEGVPLSGGGAEMRAVITQAELNKSN